MSTATLKFATIAALLAVTFTVTSKAQQAQWSWPEKPQNLQVLNKDWPGSRLRPVMTGFTRALGVRCSYCHVGKEGQPLTTYDFVSDENPNKNRAREMLRMLGDINVHLKKLEPSGDQRVNMWCNTCHRGRPRPMTLEEELGEQYRLKGIDTALLHYQDLKKNYAEKGAYDFSEQSLNNFGYLVLEKKDTPAALRVFTMNAQAFPKSANVWDSLADAYLRAGDLKSAKRYYERSLKLDPKSESAQENLKKIAELTKKK
ncbi:MAG TPA: c-type cytochrome [Pyrinomonadaceae bacterium]|nr:c-type cytochrome [Pyrinomonadaceae bacterium]